MNKRFFELAEKISKKSVYKHRIGSVITFKDKKILGLGFNAVKTHPRSPQPHYRTIHSELSAILNSGLEDFTNCSIYNFRKTPGGKIALSFPCKYCMQLLINLNFKEINYSSNNGYENKRLY